MDAETLGRRLRSARAARGLSQQEVAQELGLARTAITQLEAGNRSVSTLELNALSELYLRRVADFLQDATEDDDSDVLVALHRTAPGLERDPATQELASGVGVVFPNQGGRGTHVNVSGAGVTTHAPNADNAVRLVEFLLGEEAQRVFAETILEYPVRPGVPWSETLHDWGQFRADTLNLRWLGELNSDAVMTFDRAGWR